VSHCGVTQRVDRTIQTIDPIRAEPKKETAKFVAAPGTTPGTKPRAADAFWIYLKGGARMRPKTSPSRMLERGTSATPSRFSSTGIASNASSVTRD